MTREEAVALLSKGAVLTVEQVAQSGKRVEVTVTVRPANTSRVFTGTLTVPYGTWGEA